MDLVNQSLEPQQVLGASRPDMQRVRTEHRKVICPYFTGRPNSSLSPRSDESQLAPTTLYTNQTKCGQEKLNKTHRPVPTSQVRLVHGKTSRSSRARWRVSDVAGAWTSSIVTQMLSDDLTCRPVLLSH